MNNSWISEYLMSFNSKLLQFVYKLLLYLLILLLSLWSLLRNYGLLARSHIKQQRNPDKRYDLPSERLPDMDKEVQLILIRVRMLRFQKSSEHQHYLYSTSPFSSVFLISWYWIQKLTAESHHFIFPASKPPYHIVRRSNWLRASQEFIDSLYH